MRLVYLSPVPWASFKQRPHRFVEWFHSRYGGQVLWVEPYPGRLPVKGDFRRFIKDSDNKKELTARALTPSWLTVLRPATLPVEPLSYVNKINRMLWRNVIHKIDEFIAGEDCVLAIGKPSDMAMQVLKRNSTVYSVYDAMDDFPAFHKGISKAAMKHKDMQIAAGVTKIQVSATRLAEKYKSYKPKLSVVLNACSVDELPPVRVRQKHSNRTILGYVGTISHWFDWELVISLANAKPDVSVRLIGPNLAPASQPLPKNIEMLPACRHEDAIGAMQNFTVGLIPFELSVLTESVDPIKYYEYRALGLPVLTTGFGEMRYRRGEPGVYFMDKDADLSRVVSEAEQFNCDSAAIQEFRNENSWSSRFDSSGLLM